MAGPQLPVISQPRQYISTSSTFSKSDAKSDFAALNNVHDLLALPLENGDVVVYRLNGQVAFTAKRRNAASMENDASVSAIDWKPNGALLAIGWTDGAWAVVSGENGRVLSRGVANSAGKIAGSWNLGSELDSGGDDGNEEVPGSEGRRISCFGWSGQTPRDNRVDNASCLDDFGDKERFDDDLNESATKQAISVASDLPHRIMTMDATEALPRLSALPPHGIPYAKAGPEGNKFSSQAAMDALFPPAQTDSKDVGVATLLVCTERGHTEILLDESVSMGFVKIPGLNPFLHVTQSLTSAHTLLCRDHGGLARLSSIRLPSVTLDRPLLQVVTTNTRRIQDLLSYITHVIRCIQHDYTSGLNFPTRLINNINMELGEKNEGTLASNLFHLVMTTNFTPTILEWLTDIVKETNHKRWHTAVDTMYQHIQSHLFMHLIPSLDRLNIATTTLRGHAIFHEDSGEFNVSPSLFTKIVSSVDALRLIVQKLLLVVMEEGRQFRAFSRWLKIMIEIGTAGPFTKSASEIEDREFASLDHTRVLEYIRDTMMSSKVKCFIEELNFEDISKEEWPEYNVYKNISYENTKTALADRDKMSAKSGRSANVETSSDTFLVNLHSLAFVLNKQTHACVDEITKWQSSLLKHPAVVSLASDFCNGERITDMRLLTKQSRGETAVTEVDDVMLISIDENQDSYLWVSALETIQPVRLAPERKETLDAKFLNQSTIMLLYRTESGGHEMYEVRFSPRRVEQPLSSTIVHSFKQDQSSFAPSRIILGDRRDKEICIVFDEAKHLWLVLDVTARARNGARSNNDYETEEGFSDIMDME